MTNSIAGLIVGITGLITAIAAIVRSAKKDAEAREKAALAKEEARRVEAVTARKDYVEQGFELMKAHAASQAAELVEVKKEARRCEDRYEHLGGLYTDLRISFARMEAQVEAMRTQQGATTATVHVPVALGPVSAVTDTPPSGIPATPAP